MKDPRIDTYIEQSAEFARPILEHLRGLVHKTIPGAGETIKWGMPHFTYKGKNVAGMAAFKEHCAFTIHGEGRYGGGDGMGSCGKLTALADLPPDEALATRVSKARERIDTAGSAVKRAPKSKAKAELPVPQDFAAALRENPKAQATFEGFPPSQRREYVEWISDAKQDATRAKRLATAVEWLSEGKRRNWKYESR
ncbi:MAG: YdeI/OmpD-associated family protein [Porphyrobacter sp.]|nr:YdeI/OmpD-associated family protein [Porphyrobacter sp.]